MEKSKLMMIIIMALLVLLLGTVGGVSFYVMNMIRNQPSLADAGSAAQQVARNLSIDEMETISLGDTMLTNLARSEGSRQNHYLRASGFIAYDATDRKEAEALAARINENIQFARSIALACIWGSTYEELSETDGPAILADRIRIRLQEEFESNLIVRVYFEDWLLQ
jgi:flagellar basal body-associated protein FliL